MLGKWSKKCEKVKLKGHKIAKVVNAQIDYERWEISESGEMVSGAT